MYSCFSTRWSQTVSSFRSGRNSNFVCKSFWNTLTPRKHGNNFTSLVVISFLICRGMSILSFHSFVIKSLLKQWTWLSFIKRLQSCKWTVNGVTKLWQSFLSFVAQIFCSKIIQFSRAWFGYKFCTLYGPIYFNDRCYFLFWSGLCYLIHLWVTFIFSVIWNVGLSGCHSTAVCWRVLESHDVKHISTRKTPKNRKEIKKKKHSQKA